MSVLKHRLLLTLLLLAVPGLTIILHDSPTIVEVSTTLGYFTAPTGSYKGGTQLYIKGTNFETNPTKNAVWVGPYPCLILADGVTQTSLACETTAATDLSKVWGLVVKVEVDKLGSAVCDTVNCRFNYQYDRTPFLQEIIPRSAVGNEQLKLMGVHRITDLGDMRSNGAGQIRYLQVGDKVCSTLDVDQEFEDDNGLIPSNSRSGILCNSFLHQPAGEYDFTELLYPGRASQSVRVKQTSLFTAANYTQRVVPHITAVDYHSSGTKGATLRLTGTGFTADVTDYSCTVAGQECQVLSADENQVVVDVPAQDGANVNMGALPQSGSDSSSQELPFLGTQGAHYRRFDRGDVWKSPSQWYDFMQTPHSLELISEKIVTEWSNPEVVHGSNYVEHLKGYFHVPVDGEYRFAAIADDNLILKMSSVPNNANPANLDTVLELQFYCSSHFNPYARVNTTSPVKNLTLTEGYYYYEMVVVDYGGAAYFKVMVDTPELHPTGTINPTWQVDRVKIAQAAYDAELLKLTAYGASGSFSLYYYYTKSDGTSGVYITTINIGASADDVTSAIKSLPKMNFSPVVRRESIDATGAATADPAATAGYRYWIEYRRIRPDVTPLLADFRNVVAGGGVAASVTLTTVTNHTAPVTGTFKLTVDGLPITVDATTSLPYDIAAWKIESALNTLYGTNEISVAAVQDTERNMGIEFVIEYVGVLEAALPVGVDSTTLLGGKNNTFTASITTEREFSSRPLYSPVPYDFLSTASDLPSLQLQVNSIPALCDDCSFEYNAARTVIIDTSVLTGASLEVMLTIPAARRLLQATVALTDITVSLGGVQCGGLTGTPDHFTCTFPTNADGSIKIPAGTYTLAISVAGYGNADAGAVSPNTVSLVINSLSISQSSPGGGVLATLVGSGFPLSETDLSISLCGNEVTEVTLVSNTELTFVVPPQVTDCTSAGSEIVAGGQTVSLTFTYNNAIAPTINALSPTNASPIMKGTLTITGSNFGAQANTRVHLQQAGKKIYELGVLSVTPTQITCVLGGGHSGQYDVVVLDTTIGASLTSATSAFEYGIFVSSVSPAQGSSSGGNRITISGSNFAPSKGSTTVFISDSVTNEICEIETITATQIVCIAPRRSPDFALNAPLDVVVTGRLIEESAITPASKYTYVPATHNQIVVGASIVTYSAASNVTVLGQSGSNLTGATVTVNGISCTVVRSSDAELVFTLPPLPADLYEVFIMTQEGIWTEPKLQVKVSLAKGALNSQQCSYGGAIATYSGYGMPTSIKNVAVQLTCAESTALPVLSATPTLVTFVVPASARNQSCFVDIFISGASFDRKTLNYTSTLTAQISTSLASGNQYSITKLTQTNLTFDSVQFVLLDQFGKETTSVYPMTMTSPSAAIFTVQPTGGYLPTGDFVVKAHKSGYGFATASDSSRVTVSTSWAANPTASAVSSSYAGGKLLTLSGAGFVNIHPENNLVTVCGVPAKVIAADTASATVVVPQIVTEDTLAAFDFKDPEVLTGIPLADTTTAAEKAFDQSLNTLYSSANAACYVGLNFGAGFKADIQQIRYSPNSAWANPAKILNGATFEISNDGVSWSTLFTLQAAQINSGWSKWVAQTPVKAQYLRFSHGAASKCELQEIEVTGILLSQITGTNSDKACDVQVLRGSKTIASAVSYSSSLTTVISDITPAFASSAGGDTIHLSGTNFGSTVTVTVDGVSCSVSSQTATDVYCIVGRRASPPEAGNSFIVTSDGSNVPIQTTPFEYVDRWSDTVTWGGEAVPREGDSVYVPKGMTLLVDESTPILKTVIVEGGKIRFADEKDMTFDAHYFIITGGAFEAGTEAHPYQHKLVFTLHGNREDKQLPWYGNKNIICRNCKFNMNGIPRYPTWTESAATVLPGTNTIALMQPVDWVAGERIVISSTTFDIYEAEERTIASVSADRTVITVTEPFKFRHYSAVEQYVEGSTTWDFPMRAEVGLLTRNIVMQGDENSDADEYGSHLMMNGKQADGLVGKISYSEFTKCGQPTIIGRYCTHFHMAGEVPESYVRGISVHHSKARVLTIHGTHSLLVEKNVGYYVKGHNIFLEDGIETHNTIQDNLMMVSIASHTMLQSDTSVASYWITNPTNIVRRNHAAGSDFYGFWYEIKEHPDGPSATSDICPEGMQVGVSEDNVAHSNKRFGLRIFKLSAREHPCEVVQNHTLQDPYSGNTAIESVFSNYILWRNEECGFLGEELGYTRITNFMTADSRKGGFQFHKTNYTKEFVVAENSLIVGYSNGNAPADLDLLYNNGRGLIAARTDGLKVSNVTFFNFGPTMTPLQSCSECWNMKVWVTGGKSTHFEKIKYVNIQGDYIFWERHRREIFIDLDGTLTESIRAGFSLPAQSSATVSPFRPSLMVPGHCYATADMTTDLWNNSVYCDHTVTMRGILLTNAIPKMDFNAIDIKVKLLSSFDENVTDLTEDNFSGEYMKIIKKSLDIKNSWAMPFATGHYYNVHWKWGLDFTHVAVAPSRLWEADEGVVLRFNYSDFRELFQIFHWHSAKLQSQIVKMDTLIDPTTCNNGDYYHDADNKYLFLCVSGRNKFPHEWTDVNGIRCINFCPNELGQGERENFTRLWSNSTQWPGGVLPAQDQNVTIPYEWQLVMDVDPPVLNFLKINGILMFDNTRDNKLEAHYIWVKQGILRVGKPDAPFPYHADIILHGEKNDTFMVIDPEASGNKMLAVTGGLELYGKVPSTVWTRMTEIAPAGATAIKVQSTSGWAVGDQIVIAPSYAGRKEHETFFISAISGNTVTLDGPLQHEHYGASGVTINNTYGVLDTRAGVGILSRNIKISSADSVSHWGGRVLIYGYYEPNEDIAIPPVWRNGYAKLFGVEVAGLSQYDTGYAAIRIEKMGSIPSLPNEIPTEMEGSSVHSCEGKGMWIDDITNVTINNNVFFSADKFLVYVEDVFKNYQFTKNLLIGAHKRDEVNFSASMIADDVSCYEQYHTIPFAEDHGVSVTGNLAQGSEGEGFVFPFSPCEYKDTYPFIDNTAGSCEVAFMYEKLDGTSCIYASKIVAYSSEIGLMANPPGSYEQLVYDQMFFADNHRGITLRYAHEHDNNAIYVKNSYFTGISRPSQPALYSDTKNSYCQGGYAVRMFTATLSGEVFPLVKKATGHDVICTQQAFDFRAFITDSTFENYLYNNPTVPYCSQMSVFKRHSGASDGTAAHHLTNTACINCQKESWAYFEKPSISWRGWFGGCGEMDCTGPNNYYIYDHTGEFTNGEKSQIISNNTVIGDNEDVCDWVPEMNGHWCHTEEFATLEYESIAADYNKRMVHPILLKYDGGNWTTQTNAWKEWAWDGSEPMNLRLSRFWSLIKLHQRYDLNFSSQPPSLMRVQIQQTVDGDGNPADWAIFRIPYPIPNSIEVKAFSGPNRSVQTIVKPKPIREGVAEDLANYVSECGANVYHYDEAVIEFVVNGVNNCQVHIGISSRVRLTARLEISISDFYTNNGATTFLTNICAFLGIDTGRMKIVGIREGSTIVYADIQADPTDTPTEAFNDLTNINDQLTQGINDGTLNVGASVLSSSTDMAIFNQNGSVYTQADQQAAEEKKKNDLIIIVLAIALPLVGVAGVASFCYWKRKRARIHEEELHNKSTANRETIKGTTEFDISAVDNFGATNYGKKWAVE